MAARISKEGLLARVNFPLYSVEMLTSRHVLVAGGGGSSKTGVANGFVCDFTSFCFATKLIIAAMTLTMCFETLYRLDIGNL